MIKFTEIENIEVVTPSKDPNMLLLIYRVKNVDGRVAITKTYISKDLYDDKEFNLHPFLLDLATNAMMAQAT